jgi:hypothetical protein
VGFRRRIKIVPGLWLNGSKRGAICRPSAARRSDTLLSILNGLLQLAALAALDGGLLALAWIATHWH